MESSLHQCCFRCKRLLSQDCPHQESPNVKAPNVLLRRSATSIPILLLAAVMAVDLLFALLSCASTAPPQEDANALTVQKQTLATTSLEISNLREQAQKGDRIAQYN